MGIAIAGRLYYAKEKAHLADEIQRQLSAIASLKVQQIVGWRAERLGDVASIADNPLVAREVRRSLDEAADPARWRDLTTWLASLREHYQYQRAVLFDDRGQPRLDLGDPGTVEGVQERALIEEAQRTRKIVFADLERDPTSGTIHLDLLAPLSLPAEKHLVGFVLLRTDPRRYLYPLIQSWPTPSRTAETLLVRRDGDSVVFLNDLRHRPGTALSLRFPLSEERLPAAMAAREQEGLIEGRDYRGAEVLAAVRRIPGSPWRIVAKMDQSEVYAPIQERAEQVMIFAIALIAMAGTGVAYLWRREQIRFYRREREAELQRLALLERYEDLTRHANDIILVIDRAGRILDANERAVSSYGYFREDLLRLNVRDLRSPELVEGVDAALAQVEAAQGLVFETVHRRRDGSTFPVEVSARLIEVDGKHLYQAIIRDISERRRAQEALETVYREREAFLAEKLDSLGVLAGGIAHDFNNLLTVILGRLSVAMRHVRAEDPAHRSLAEATKAAGRARDLSRQLLAFAKGGAPVKELRSVAQILEEVRSLALCGSNVICRMEVTSDLWPAEIDRGQIFHVFSNLALNAIQAMPQGGTVEVTADNVVVPAGVGGPLAPGDYVRIRVKDQGVGIAPANLGRIFDPYFTTKEAGTGLGLAIVYSVVKKHGGHVSVESKEGEGSTFTVHLPAQRAALPRALAPSDGAPPGGQGRILVMDDDEAIREALRDMLESLGYEAQLASDGARAVALYEEAQRSGRPFAAVIADLAIPGAMGGQDALIRLRQIDPRVRAIVSSGYFKDGTMSTFREHGFAAVLPKPYDTDKLGNTLHEVLGEPS
jgi:PAS domain S-box-containing protein